MGTPAVPPNLVPHSPLNSNWLPAYPPSGWPPRLCSGPPGPPTKPAAAVTMTTTTASVTANASAQAPLSRSGPLTTGQIGHETTLYYPASIDKQCVGMSSNKPSNTVAKVFHRLITQTTTASPNTVLPASLHTSPHSGFGPPPLSALASGHMRLPSMLSESPSTGGQQLQASHPLHHNQPQYLHQPTYPHYQLYLDCQQQYRQPYPSSMPYSAQQTGQVYFTPLQQHHKYLQPQPLAPAPPSPPPSSQLASGQSFHNQAHVYPTHQQQNQLAKSMPPQTSEPTESGGPLTLRESVASTAVDARTAQRYHLAYRQSMAPEAGADAPEGRSWKGFYETSEGRPELESTKRWAMSPRENQ
ncbi:unnamed protein product, partial [Protopolystoma xenopodis]